MGKLLDSYGNEVVEGDIVRLIHTGNHHIGEYKWEEQIVYEAVMFEEKLYLRATNSKRITLVFDFNMLLKKFSADIALVDRGDKNLEEEYYLDYFEIPR